MTPLNDEILKQKIINIVKRTLGKYRVMFIYFGGSLAYDTYIQGKSDIDVNVVVDGLKGYSHINIQDIDFFIYGKEVALEKQSLSNHLPLYFKTYIDEVLAIDNTLIYLDNEYLDYFEKYKEINIQSMLKEFLDIFISYHEDILKNWSNIPIKRLHHILRMKGIIQNYVESGKYELIIPLEHKELIKNYKLHYQDEQGLKIYEENIIPAFSFIKKFKESLKGGASYG